MLRRIWAPFGAVALTAAFLAMPCAVAMAADEAPPPTVFDHWVFWPKAGQDAQFEEAAKAHLAWRKGAGEGREWTAYRTLVGDDLTPYFYRAGPFHWKDLDSQAAWATEARAVADFNERAGPYVGRMEHYLNVLDVEHSLWTDSEEYRYFGVSLLRLKPGAYDGMVAALTQIHKVAVEKEWPQSWAIMWMVGGSDADLMIVWPYRSYAEMAEPETPFLKLVTESVGSEAAAKALLNQFWSSFEAGSYQIVTTRPDLSTPKE
jgi:hypothetical protein